MTKKSKGLWMAIIGASFWGGSGAAAQYLFANTSMTAIWLVTVRLLFGGGIMLLIGLGTVIKLRRFCPTNATSRS